jgi:hypothetical protein
MTSTSCELPFLLPDGKFGKVLVVPNRETKRSVLQKLVDIRKYPIDYQDSRQQEELADSFSMRNKNAKPIPPGDPSPIHTRTWAFQEYMLSTRLLIFGPDDAHWRCQKKQLEPLFPNPLRFCGAANRVSVAA